MFNFDNVSQMAGFGPKELPEVECEECHKLVIYRETDRNGGICDWCAINGPLV